MSEWLGHGLSIEGMPVGKFSLKVGGKVLGTSRSREGDDLGFLLVDEHFVHSERLRQAIIDKNRLYFYRWRPQNITYLFLFRKHEQGQNAKELAEFDKLIAAKEKEIAKLRKPVAHTYEIIRAKEDADK